LNRFRIAIQLFQNRFALGQNRHSFFKRKNLFLFYQKIRPMQNDFYDNLKNSAMFHVKHLQKIPVLSLKTGTISKSFLFRTKRD